jgi:amidase
VDTDICFRSALDLATAVRTRQLSATEVVQAHLDRIERTNPHVNAITTLVAERALQEAREADARTVSGADVGPLHGLPIAHKDTHATAGIRTTSGSPIMRDRVPEHDDLIVSRLRRAGAISIGKTNVPEFSAGAHTFNPLFGVTRNPYDLERTAGGSSGGAAAALAAGMHPLADGSDMGGSLRFPAGFCNVVGLRPSAGRVPSRSKDGWDSLTVQGPMARSVSDLAHMLSVIAGPDRRSPISLQEPGSVFGAELDSDPRGLKVAWSPDFGGELPMDPEASGIVERQAEVFAGMGCHVEQECPDFSGADESFHTMRAWQLELSLGGLVDRNPDLVKDSLLRNVETGRELTAADLGRAVKARTRLFQRVADFFERYDVLALPVSQVPPFPVDHEYPTEIAGVEHSTYLDWMRSCTWVTATGHPAVSVPAGFTATGLPMGLQLVGKHRHELALLRAARAFERATGHGRHRPEIAGDPRPALA